VGPTAGLDAMEKKNLLPLADNTFCEMFYRGVHSSVITIVVKYKFEF
jgi:hypothetical protein